MRTVGPPASGILLLACVLLLTAMTVGLLISHAFGRQPKQHEAESEECWSHVDRLTGLVEQDRRPNPRGCGSGRRSA